MKKVSFLAMIIFLFLGTWAQAQVFSGRIVYESKTDLHKNIPPEMSSLKERIPQYRTTKHELLFTNKETLFKAIKDESAEPQRRRGGRFRMGGGNTEIYRDLTTNDNIESSNFFGKQFLILGELEKYDWKITGKTKQVGDYLCQQAEIQDTSRNIMVWFTPMIPVSAGPRNFNGLPGMILYADIGEGTNIITATSISMEELEEDAIVKPTEGEEITREKFSKMREEKMKEMQEEFGGRGNRRFMFRG